VHRTGRSTGPWRRNDISAQTRHENQPVHRTGRSTGPWRRNALSSWARAAVPSTGSQIHAAQCAMPLTRACLRPVSRKCTNELTEDGVQRTEDVLPVERVVTNSVRACGSRSLARSLARLLSLFRSLTFCLAIPGAQNMRSAAGGVGAAAVIGSGLFLTTVPQTVMDMYMFANVRVGISGTTVVPSMDSRATSPSSRSSTGACTSTARGRFVPVMCFVALTACPMPVGLPMFSLSV
jgi:hypothetical protein